MLTVISTPKLPDGKITLIVMPNKNVEYEIINVRQETQKPEESLDMYHTRLKILLHTVNSVDHELKSHIIQLCVNNTLRLKALQDTTLTLDKILTLYSTHETLKVRAAQIVSENKI